MFRCLTICETSGCGDSIRARAYSNPCLGSTRTTPNSTTIDPISEFFLFSSRRRHTRSDRDWSSDVYSSDLCDLYKYSIVVCLAHSNAKGLSPQLYGILATVVYLCKDHTRKMDFSVEILPDNVFGCREDRKSVV